MPSAVHSWNWYVGWGLVFSAFLTGAWLGLCFHREGFLGGYDSFRRRLVRLGHIAQAALGMLNILYGLSPWPVATDWHARAASVCFITGGVCMPLVCFLTAWKEAWRPLFTIPVVSLLLAVLLTLQGGP